MTDNHKKVENNQDRIDELRRLILLPEQQEIAKLQQRLDDQEIHADELSDVLPSAIEKSSQRNNALSEALMPTVEQAVKDSVTKDITTFADALYPVMGPAIRRSISETFKEMLQSLNQSLENSFSWQGVQWRLEAMRTGQSFSQIVMLRSFVYKVEQVFLIHKETGSLLQHVSAIDEEKDADMVSGMFTAISDFVQDSFNVKGKSTLDSIHINELTVILEDAPLATIAIVIRGSAPKGIRDDLRHILELIHLEQRDVLVDFDGDTDHFKRSRPHLEGCLVSRQREKEDKKFFTAQIAVLLTAVIVIIIWWLFFSYQYESNWNNYVEKLRQEPGIAITNVREDSGHMHITGLRDPLSRTPQEIRDESVPISEDNISYHFEYYQALVPEFILKRAKKRLLTPPHISLSLDSGVLKAEGIASYQWQQQSRNLARTIAGIESYNDSAVINADLSSLNPPSTVKLSLQDGTLTATGKAPYEWLLLARKQVKTIWGVERYDDTQLVNQDILNLAIPNTVNLELIKGVLTATGNASHEEVVRLKQQVSLISGVDIYDDSGLNDVDKIQINNLIQELEQKTILFQASSYGKATEQMKQNTVLDDVKTLFKLATKFNQDIVIYIVGHSDITGSYDKNIALSQKRAGFVRQYFIDNGISESNLQAQGVGSSLPIGNNLSGIDKELNRSVTFSIFVSTRE